jgi:UDP-3-O-[3-hydroxymyristoyl] glucosamine N-acyltransferase
LKLTLSEIASHVDGKVMGDSDYLIIGVSEIQDAKPHTITFLGNPLYRKYLIDTKADAIFVNNAKLLEDKNGIVVKNPQLAMAKTLALFSTKETEEPHIDPRSVISERCNYRQISYHESE